MQYVPVVDFEQRPLMPTTPARAERWIKSGKATPFFRKGIFCVRLNVEPSNRHTQPVAVGIDPGSKREGYTVKSKAHTYLNQQFHAVDWVKEAEETSTNARRARRNRKTPCRQPRQNRSRGGIPPSTKARWQFKIRVVKVFDSILPISGIGIEDVKALTKKGCHKWNTSFSPLEVGKKWCYSELERIAPVTQFDGYTDTYLTRQKLGLKKSKVKLSNVFYAHCVDSWVLAYLLVGGDRSPENMVVMECKPIRIYRRQLHVFNPGKNGYRRPYGGSMSQGLKRGGIVKHLSYGKCYVGGEDSKKSRISLHSLGTGKRLCQNAKPTDCKFLAYNSWRTVKPS
ncbi:RRXRR domain-containing protein [Microcoleus vaginatus]|uniref:RRXRR domain-containing protein n=1 Tax=Microcoleus vaginatus TaxID=119532 RepID=UPI001684FC01|nr:RRXRR domain-containing protein [Microcoleus sp. FACHB-84]MBD2011214.1 RRXRR domain-containing protein [Microcoleus sp. FACHB-45]